MTVLEFNNNNDKKKIFSVEILLRMICQKLMSNDACNFVILYMVCKIDIIFYEDYWVMG